MAREKHEHQRITYYEIRAFLENPPEGCKLAVLTGIRRIGKTSVLTDLEATLPNTKYINLSRNMDIKAELLACLDFVKAGTGVLLIDEITQYPNYEALVEYIEDAVYNKATDLRVVFTGSSSLHLMALKSGLLGAGRSKLFRMSFLSFAEYLVFTGRKTGEGKYRFKETSNVSESDFKDYLQLKNLPAEGLKISFDHAYMVELYRDISLANQSSRNPGAFSALDEDDILCILDLVAYTFRNLTTWTVFKNPDGARELLPLGVTGIDKNTLKIYLTAKQLNAINPRNIARALYYLLVANLAYIDTSYDDPNRVSASKLAEQLFDITTRLELKQIFDNHNICLINPLWYMRIAKEISEQYGFPVSQLLDTRIIGEVLENYVKGAYCHWSHQYEYEISDIGIPNAENICRRRAETTNASTSFSATEEVNVFELRYNTQRARTNEARKRSTEVDICDAQKNVLCEITVSDKDWKDVNLMKHFQDTPYIRIVSTKTADEFTYETHKIPYPKLCAMVDTGEIFKLDRSVLQQKSAPAAAIQQQEEAPASPQS